MIDSVQKILKHELREILDSPLVLTLLSIYSTLYLNGKQPSSCSACIKKYYLAIKTNGMERAKEFEAAKNRTNKPKWDGLRFSSKAQRHFNSRLITDEQAIDLLNKGIFTPSDFEILPEGYKKPVKEKKENGLKSEPVEKPKEPEAKTDSEKTEPVGKPEPTADRSISPKKKPAKKTVKK